MLLSQVRIRKKDKRLVLLVLKGLKYLAMFLFAVVIFTVYTCVCVTRSGHDLGYFIHRFTTK